MKRKQLHNRSITGLTIRSAKAIYFAAVVLALATAPASQAQTFYLLHTFTGYTDSAYPYAAPILDGAGNLYGTTFGRSNGGVYELQRHGSDWIFKSLYQFQGGNDGSGPHSPVAFGPDGALYGTTIYGGNVCFGIQCGTVYSLRPPAHFCANVNCPWTERPVYLFGGSQIHDGYHPSDGPLAFDSAGNIYGTTSLGGRTGNGTVFQLVRQQNGWVENVLDNFQGLGTPAQPEASVTLDAAGNLYGTAKGYSFGDAYGLLRMEQQWIQQTIYTFQGGDDGAYPSGGLIFDAAGNAYGTTTGNGEQPGTVFQLTRQGDGTWRETVLHVFAVGSFGPKSNLTMDAAGNLFGTTEGLGGFGGDRFGMVFKLSQVNGSSIFTDLYDFTGGADGSYPVGGVTVDSAGNLYGTCVNGGAHNYGTVWEITP